MTHASLGAPLAAGATLLAASGAVVVLRDAGIPRVVAAAFVGARCARERGSTLRPRAR